MKDNHPQSPLDLVKAQCPEMYEAMLGSRREEFKGYLKDLVPTTWKPNIESNEIELKYSFDPDQVKASGLGISDIRQRNGAPEFIKSVISEVVAMANRNSQKFKITVQENNTNPDITLVFADKDKLSAGKGVAATTIHGDINSASAFLTHNTMILGGKELDLHTNLMHELIHAILGVNPHPHDKEAYLKAIMSFPFSCASKSTIMAYPTELTKYCLSHKVTPECRTFLTQSDYLGPGDELLAQLFFDKYEILQDILAGRPVPASEKSAFVDSVVSKVSWSKLATDLPDNLTLLASSTAISTLGNLKCGGNNIVSKSTAQAMFDIAYVGILASGSPSAAAAFAGFAVARRFMPELQSINTLALIGSQVARAYGDIAQSLEDNNVNSDMLSLYNYCTLALVGLLAVSAPMVYMKIGSFSGQYLGDKLSDTKVAEAAKVVADTGSSVSEKVSASSVGSMLQSATNAATKVATGMVDYISNIASIDSVEVKFSKGDFQL